MPELDRIDRLQVDGIAQRDAARIEVGPGANTWARVLSAVFDAYLAPDAVGEHRRRASLL